MAQYMLGVTIAIFRIYKTPGMRVFQRFVVILKRAESDRPERISMRSAENLALCFLEMKSDINHEYFLHMV
jgi:hypothetical protein